MMQNIEKKNRQENKVPLGTETVKFLFKKVKALMPEYVIAWFLSFGIVCFARRLTLRKIATMFMTRSWELFFVKMTGMNGGDIDGVMWYISAMLLSMAILYPLLRKWTNSMLNLILPIAALVILGNLYQLGTLRTQPQRWIIFTYKGMLRAISEISIGAICFEVTQRFGKLALNIKGKALVTLVKYIGWISVFVYILLDFPEKTDYFFMFVIALSLILTFSGQGLDANWYNVDFFQTLGKFSTSLYLCHIAYRNEIAGLLPGITDKRIMFGFYLISSCLTALFVMCVSNLLRKNKEVIFKLIEMMLIQSP